MIGTLWHYQGINGPLFLVIGKAKPEICAFYKRHSVWEIFDLYHNYRLYAYDDDRGKLTVPATGSRELEPFIP